MHVLKGSIPPEMIFSLRKCMLFECNLVSMSAVQKFRFPSFIASYNIIQVCSRSCGSNISMCSHKTPLSIQPKIEKTQTSSKFTRRPRQSRKNYPQNLPRLKKKLSELQNQWNLHPLAFHGFSPWFSPWFSPSPCRAAAARAGRPSPGRAHSRVGGSAAPTPLRPRGRAQALAKNGDFMVILQGFHEIL